MVLRKVTRFVVYAVLLILVMGVFVGISSHSSAQADSKFFPETGKTVTQPFLNYWNNHGGLAQQGYPITDSYDEKNDDDGKIYRTQYFERARFEYHPEKEIQFQVLLGLLGREALKAKYGSGSPTGALQTVPGTGSRLFPETGKTVTGLFLAYWTNHGGLEQQGYPITEAYNEVNDDDGKTYITQYFERARFEYHPESPQEQFKVLLGLVGREVYNLKLKGGGKATPTTGPAQPTQTTAPTQTTGGATATTAPTHTNTPIPTNTTVATATATPQGYFPGMTFTSVDAVGAWPNGKVYFFKGSQYIRFDIANNRADPGYPKTIEGNWPGMTFIAGIDEVIVIPTANMAIFFRGSQFIQYDIANDRAFPGGPFQISQFGTAGLVFTNIGAGDAWPNPGPFANKIYFFTGSQYVRFDIATNAVDTGYPKAIAGHWPDLPYTDNIDAVGVWNGKAYFFKGSEFVRYDTVTDRADPGYPKPIGR